MSLPIFFALYLNILISTIQLDYKIPFNIIKPEIKVALPNELKEISGLAWVNQSILAAIQDEAGIIYFIDSKSGEIKEKINFSTPGDFEGVALVEQSLYAINSSGTLFTFNINTPKKVKQIETPLTWKNNTEGLAYDIKNNRLLIACKDEAGIHESKVKGKAIYALNLSDHQLSKKPLILIRKSKIEAYLKVKKFKPSALAIDPLTGNLYVLASAGNLLIVLDHHFELIAGIRLPSKMYGQPEGICFSPEGDLYLSNEGKDNKKANFYHLLRHE